MLSQATEIWKLEKDNERHPLLLVGLLAVAPSLGAAPTEIVTGVACAGALVLCRRQLGPSLAPMLALTLAFALAARGSLAGLPREILAMPWSLAPLLLVPALASTRSTLAERAGLAVAAAIALSAVGQRLLDLPPVGLTGHHLSLGYGLLPPLAVALDRRRTGLTLALLAGVIASGGQGPLLSAAIVLLGARLFSPGLALALGAATALALIGLGSAMGQEELHTRAMLWRSGAELALQHPFGTGGDVRPLMTLVQARLDPDFHFPLHAHDGYLQLALRAGFGGLLALAWLLSRLWSAADRAGRAALGGLLVGALTQDLFGDLLVARSMAFWLAWSALAAEPSARADVRTPQPE